VCRNQDEPDASASSVESSSPAKKRKSPHGGASERKGCAEPSPKGPRRSATVHRPKAGKPRVRPVQVDDFEQEDVTDEEDPDTDDDLLSF